MAKKREFLKVLTIRARDLAEAWWLSMERLFESGYKYKIDKGSFAGQQRMEFDFVTIQILHPGIRPLVPGIDLPQGVPPPADIDYIQKDYIFYMMTSIKKPNEAYTYGEYLEDQIPKVIKMYKEGGFETNQACMRIGDANSLTLSDPPCLTKIDTRIRYGKLHFHVDFRSWDLWAGFPTNLAAIQLLKEYMASEIGVKDGEIIATSKGLHLYEHSWELAKVVLRR